MATRFASADSPPHGRSAGGAQRDSAMQGIGRNGWKGREGGMKPQTVDGGEQAVPYSLGQKLAVELGHLPLPREMSQKTSRRIQASFIKPDKRSRSRDRWRGSKKSEGLNDGEQKLCVRGKSCDGRTRFPPGKLLPPLCPPGGHHQHHQDPCRRRRGSVATAAEDPEMQRGGRREVGAVGREMGGSNG